MQHVKARGRERKEHGAKNVYRTRYRKRPKENVKNTEYLSYNLLKRNNLSYNLGKQKGLGPWLMERTKTTDLNKTTQNQIKTGLLEENGKKMVPFQRKREKNGLGPEENGKKTVWAWKKTVKKRF